MIPDILKDKLKTEQDYAKFLASQKALSYIENDMILGLGTGSTINIFLTLLKDHIEKNSLNVKCVCTSEQTRKIAESFEIPLFSMHEAQKTDLTIDGTDEFDAQLNLIKGGGGALLCEKIIAQSCEKFIVISDESKFSETFGRYPLPIELSNFELGITFAQLQKIFEKHGGEGKIPQELRKTTKGKTFITDMGNVIIDINFQKITNPIILAQDLLSIAGVVEHGLFIELAGLVITDKQDYYK